MACTTLDTMDTFTQILSQVTAPTLIFFFQALIVLALFVAAVGALISIVASAGMRARPQARLEARSLNDEWNERRHTLESFFLSKKDLKARLKQDKTLEKERVEGTSKKKRLWVLDFKGDVEASHVDCLRNEITAILDVAKAAKEDGADEVLIRLESPGGTVTGYGHAAHQLERLKMAKIPTTVAIDEMAASGGYMMAVVADRVVASNLAVIGSIGVVGQVPNIHRLLKRLDVDVLEMTAGTNKRPVSLLGPLTDQGIETFKKQLVDTHRLFRDHVKKHRPQLDIEAVSNGDIWHGVDALKIGLVDEIATSDDWIDRARYARDMDVFSLKWRHARSIRERLEESVSTMVERAVLKALQRIKTPLL